MSIDEKRLQEIENSISSAVSSFGPAIMTLNFDSRDLLVMTTEIRTLRAENERLKADVSSWEEDGAVLPEDMSITETVNALRAEKESLRERVISKLDDILSIPFQDKIECEIRKFISELES